MSNLLKPEDLSGQAASGVKWQSVASLTRAFSSLGFGIILARLLPPEDFGIVAIAYVVTSFALILVDVGLRPSLVQRTEITPRHVRVCHTVSLLVAVVFLVALFASADAFARFFAEPRLAAVLRVLAFSFVLTGFSATSAAILSRRMAFRISVRIELIGSIVGYGLFAVALAAAGYGYWSLVGGTMLQAAIASTLTFLAVRHPLKPLLARGELSDLMWFGSGVSLARIGGFFAQKGDYFVIGRLMDSASLGFYSRAYALMELPLILFGTALSRVLFPAASRVQSEPERFKRAYLISLFSCVVISVPISLALVILAPEIVLTVYGDKWQATVPLLQILSLFGMFSMIEYAAIAFVKARGRTKQLLISKAVYGGLVVGGGWVGAITYGLPGIAWAVGGAMTAMCLLIVISANRAAEVSAVECGRTLIRAMLPGVLLAGALYAVVATLRGLGVSPVWILIGSGGTFAAVAAFTALCQVRSLRHPALNALLNPALSRLRCLRSSYSTVAI
jgi:O-antigen/teichoic acid export membrane protein